MTRWRYALILPFAGGMTLGLLILMKAVVSTEFVPQPTDRDSETVTTFVYEPVISGGFRGLREAYDARFPALVPPYRNVISDPFMQNPHDERRAYMPLKPEILKTKPAIDFRGALLGELSCHWNHGVRVPPKFPQSFIEGNTSGLCKVSFIYDENGQAGDVEIISCTDEVLVEPTLKAVNQWRQTRNSCSKENARGERQSTTIRYDLVDEGGNKLPLP